MIVCAVLNGYAASMRAEKTRTNRLVENLLKASGKQYSIVGLKALLVRSHARRLRRFVECGNYETNSLLLVGKSLGARNIVRFVLNNLGQLHYHTSFLLTIDPNWPTFWDFTPNLSHRELRVTKPITQAVNLRVDPQHPRQQCGARLVGPAFVPITDIPLGNCTHYSIVPHPRVREELEKLIADLR
jgi:hypothetical protein